MICSCSVWFWVACSGWGANMVSKWYWIQYCNIDWRKQQLFIPRKCESVSEALVFHYNCSVSISVFAFHWIPSVQNSLMRRERSHTHTHTCSKSKSRERGREKIGTVTGLRDEKWIWIPKSSSSHKQMFLLFVMWSVSTVRELKIYVYLFCSPSFPLCCLFIQFDVFSSRSLSKIIALLLFAVTRGEPCW